MNTLKRADLVHRRLVRLHQPARHYRDVDAVKADLLDDSPISAYPTPVRALDDTHTSGSLLFAAF